MGRACRTACQRGCWCATHRRAASSESEAPLSALSEGFGGHKPCEAPRASVLFGCPFCSFSAHASYLR
jgi:hypothetical protein